MGIEPGDVLLRINKQEIGDVFDYRYYIKDDYIEVLIRKADGEEWLLEIDKDYDDDLGIEFDNGLMSDYRSCSNKCIFCFIDQLPKGMRETMYFKDDDSRLSFLQGNYITMTNMKDEALERIIRYKLEPSMFSAYNQSGTAVYDAAQPFCGQDHGATSETYEGGIIMNGQIVLCRGVNDGAELERSIRELTAYMPQLESVSVVPVGLTRYRDRFSYHLEPI